MFDKNQYVYKGYEISEILASTGKYSISSQFIVSFKFDDGMHTWTLF